MARKKRGRRRRSGRFYEPWKLQCLQYKTKCFIKILLVNEHRHSKHKYFISKEVTTDPRSILIKTEFSFCFQICLKLIELLLQYKNEIAYVYGYDYMIGLLERVDIFIASVNVPVFFWKQKKIFFLIRWNEIKSKINTKMLCRNVFKAINIYFLMQERRKRNCSFATLAKRCKNLPLNRPWLSNIFRPQYDYRNWHPASSMFTTNHRFIVNEINKKK